MLHINDFILQAQQKGASDLHIVCGLPIKCRLDGKMQTLSDTVPTPQDCEVLAQELAGAQFETIRESGELDLALTADCGVRVRANIFHAGGALSFAIRLLNDVIPEIEDLDLPPIALQLPTYPSGLVLITGETGSGKSTTLAAVLNRINHTVCRHIITLEDPIEYIYTSDQCLINQREIGKDTASYADGLRAILREDPDVILIGEMRDLTTIEAALTAAETGHLVFATLHTNSAADAVDRIVSVFPDGRQRQIRTQLAATLRVVISQQLVERQGGGRIAACEVMVVNAAIRNLIREGKTPQMESFITMNSREGSILMDHALTELARAGKISMQTAAAHARGEQNRNPVR